MIAALKRIRGLSLAVEIGLVFVILGLVPMIIIGWQYARAAERQIQEEIRRNLSVIADNRAAELEGFARARLRDVQMLASAPLAEQAIEAITAAGQDDGAPSRITLGRFEPALIRAAESVAASGLYLIGPDGELIFAQGGDLQDNQQRALLQVFDRAATLLEPQMSEFLPEPGGGFSALLAAPILRGAALRGVVGLRIGLAEVEAILSDHRMLGDTGEAMIGAPVNEGIRLHGALRFAESAPPDRIIPSDAAAARPFLAASGGQRGFGLAASGGQRGFGLATDYRAVQVIAAWRYLPSFNWALVVKADEAERMQRITQLRLMGGVILLAMTALMIVIAWLAARAISTPVEEREAELRRARDQAESAARTKAEFLAMMSHEIRTPLNGLLGVAQLLDASDLDQDARAHVRTIRQSGAALAELLNGILDLSRIEAGKLEFDSRDFDLAQLAQGIADLLHSEAEAKGVALSVECDPGLPPWLRGDPARLRQILFNLLGNAVKFTEKGRVTLRLILLGKDDEKAHLRLLAEDTGIGIPVSVRDRLFQPFDQISAERSTRYGGAGLGLAISQRLAEGMDGMLGYEPNPGGGSRFFLDLGLALGRSPQPAEPPKALPTLSVLLVEDEPVNRRVLAAFLQADGHRLREAADAAEALAVLDAENFDLVLTDLRLPGLSGLELTRQIKARGGPPVIAVTANVMPEDRAACAAVGIVEIVPKPVLSSDLRAALSRAWTPLFDPAYLEDLAAILPQPELARLIRSAEQAIRAAGEDFLDDASPQAAHRLAGAAGAYGLMRLRAFAKRAEKGQRTAENPAELLTSSLAALGEFQAKTPG